jgi:hypothetical protein
MEEKKHLPIEQLRELGQEANRMLREKGIHTQESAVDRILKENKVVLPGIPAYLPHRWTLQESRRYMKDILKLWADKNKGNQRRQEKTEAFFAFLVNELTRLEEEAQKKVDVTPSLLKSLTESLWVWRVFTPLRILETTQAITRFMVDSFAVSMVVKEHHTTTEFAEWFMQWTLSLEEFWKSKEEKDK